MLKQNQQIDALPVFVVTQVGIKETQAKKLFQSLDIPPEKLLFRNGLVQFLDPVNYLAVPKVLIDDPETVAEQRKITKNFFSKIPIEVKAIDYNALRQLSVPDKEDAMKIFSIALEDSGLKPESAMPVAGHAIFKTISTEKLGEETSIDAKIDTNVSFRFTLNGYPLVGPGAQIQVSFGPKGKVTRLLYSVRSLKEGSKVKIISPEKIRGKLLRMLPDDATVKLRIVYWAPPLSIQGKSSKECNPQIIIPWYAVTVKTRLVDPQTKATQTRTSRIRLIPATGDSRFIPSATLDVVTQEKSQVNAHVSAEGGTPPYTYIWAGSNPAVSDNAGDSVTYTPITRSFRTPPEHPHKMIEYVTVTVVDANGISAVASQSIQVIGQSAPSFIGDPNSVTYGCESPNDPGPDILGRSFSPERNAWQKAMKQPGAGGGLEKFCWLGNASWPGDYIESSSAGTLSSKPWINGDADYSNWGINTANIVLYNGDGSPDGIAEMFPGAKSKCYNVPAGWGLPPGGFLMAPNNQSVTVKIGTSNYLVNYKGSWGTPSPSSNLQWLAMYACEMLVFDNSNGSPWQRWGLAFNGLHSMLGFVTEAAPSGVGFTQDFPFNILGVKKDPMTIVQGWIDAAMSNQIGTPAAMGPIKNFVIPGINGRVVGISDYDDYYWGKGTVGPTIPKPNINSWWYVIGTDAVQIFPLP